MREALRLLCEADEDRARIRARFEEEVREAIDELDRGEGLDGETVMEELRLHIAAKSAR